MQEQSGAPGIPKQPLPTAVAWELVSAETPDGQVIAYVALSFATPSGVQTYFLPRINARAMLDGLTKILADMPLESSPRARLIVPQVDGAAVMQAIERNGKEH